MHIATFLKDIALHGKTGHLSFFRGGIQKHFYFQEGSLIFIKTNIKGERLGEVLLAMGKILRPTYDAIPSLIQPDSMLGETLVQEKLISRQDLYEGLVEQMTLVTLNAFSIFDAEIVFRDRDRFFEGGLQQKMDLVGLIARGVREMSVSPGLKEFLTARIPARSGDQNLSVLTGDERAVFDPIDGEKDLGVLSASCPAGPDALQKTVFLLFSLGLIELRSIPISVTSPEPAAAAATDLELRIAEAADLQARMSGLDDYQILEVRSDSSEDEIKKAYFRMARKFHPDLFGRNIAPQQKTLVGTVFDGITNAYHNLLAKLVRPEKAARPVTRSAPSVPAKSKSTETLFRQAKTLYNVARYEEAIALLEEAVRAKDDKGDYFLLLAMAQSRIPTLRKKAEKSFLNAIALEPWNPEALIGLGMLYKKEGLMARARKQFERAVVADPDHPVARQELKAMQQSKAEPQKGLKGILSKDLFPSKKK